MLTFRQCGFQALVLFGLWAFPCGAQLPLVSPGKPAAAPAPANGAPAPPKDPRGRTTPQSTLLNFMKYAQGGDYETASKYFQLNTPKQNQQAQELARQLLALINSSFQGSIAAVSDLPEGNVLDVDDPRTDVAGKLVVGDQQVQILMVRVVRPDVGPIWLISGPTLEQVPGLYQNVGSPRLAKYFPDILMRHSLGGILAAQWIAWLIAIPMSLALAWALVWIAYLFAGLRRRSVPLRSRPQARKPLIFSLAILFNGSLVMLIGLPLLYRVYYFRVLAVLLTICVAWMSARLADMVYRYRAFSSLQRGSRSLLQLLHGLYNAAIVIVAILVVVSLLGFHTQTLLAGLGIGGIALALAAQKSLEGLLGGITLVMDKTASVGDDCMIAGRYVTVQEIGLRSIRVITREGTEMAIPNGLVAQGIIENFSRRKKFLIASSLHLSYECSLAQLQCVIANVREILYAHARVEQGTARIRLSGVTPIGYEVELFAYVNSLDAMEFAAIQEDILFRSVKVVESSGAIWAIPSQVTYLSKEKAFDAKKIAESEETVQKWQETKQAPFPDFSPSHIADIQGTLAYPPEESVLRQK